MNNPFTVEETNLICIFQSDSRAIRESFEIIEKIRKIRKNDKPFSFS